MDYIKVPGKINQSVSCSVDIQLRFSILLLFLIFLNLCFFCVKSAMKVFIVLTVAMLAVHVIGAPTNSTDTVNDIKAEKVKTDISSPLNDVTDLVMEEEDEKPRTKKAISPQTVCMEVKDNNGLSHLQCDDQLGSSSSYGGAAYAPAPPSYSSSSSSSGYASPAASYGGYASPAPSKPSYSASSYGSSSGGYSVPAPKPSYSSYAVPSTSYGSNSGGGYSVPAPRPYSAPIAPSYGGYSAPAQPSYGSYREMNQAQAEHEQMMMAFAQMDQQIGAPQPSYGPPPPSYGAPPPSYGASANYGAPAPAAYSPPAYIARPSYGSVAPGPAHAYRFVLQNTFVFLLIILLFHFSYPSPAPSTQCPSNLMFSCQPSVAPVPCQSVNYAPASRPSYSAPAAPAAPSYAAPAAPPAYREMDAQIDA